MIILDKNLYKKIPEKKQHESSKVSPNDHLHPLNKREDEDLYENIQDPLPILIPTCFSLHNEKTHNDSNFSHQLTSWHLVKELNY
jgi:hypothetical protein